MGFHVERKIFDLKIKKAMEEEDKGIIEGLASTFNNEDRVQDIILPGAFTKSLNGFRSKQQNIPLLFGHNDRDLPLGGLDPNKTYEDSNGLNVVGKLDLDTQRGRDAFSLLKKGFLNSFSIGFVSNDFDYRSGGGTVFKNVDLMEVSIVNVPANPMANISSVKTVTPYKDLPLTSEDRGWDKNAALPRVKEFTKSTDSPSSTYKNAFLWYDADNPEDYGSYKLPYADVVDGSLKAVPRAIFAAAAALRGARSGVDIPDSDKDKIISNINKYYSKMGRTSPFNGKRLDYHAQELLKCLKKWNTLFDIKKILE